MTQAIAPTTTLTRRGLLARTVAAAGSFALGTGWVASRDAAWALEVTHLQPETMATLIQMARDIYPHDHVGDDFYARAVKAYDSAETVDTVEAGIAGLNAAASHAGHASYLAIGWERDRVDILRGMEADPFFQQIRGGLVTGLYNQKEIWPLFGYEGESYSKGGYLNRGFDDIAWV